jgi:hypothetical protein
VRAEGRSLEELSAHHDREAAPPPWPVVRHEEPPDAAGAGAAPREAGRPDAPRSPA